MIGLLFGLFPLAALAAVDGDELDWLAGHWCNAQGEELWLPARNRLMLGLSRSRHGERTFFEYLRIEFDGDDARYVAQPGGQPPTAFVRTEAGERSVSFANPDHDFPKRIRYWRTGDRLHAAIDDGMGGGEMRFDWGACAAAD